MWPFPKKETDAGAFAKALQKPGLDKILADRPDIFRAQNGIFVGSLPIISPSVMQQLAEGLQKKFAKTQPDALNQVLHYILYDMTSNTGTLEGAVAIKNRHIFDPNARYAQISANAAMAHSKNKERANMFWDRFVQFAPTYDQTVKYGAAFSKNQKIRSYAYLYQDAYREYQQLAKNVKLFDVSYELAYQDKNPYFKMSMEQETYALDSMYGHVTSAGPVEYHVATQQGAQLLHAKAAQKTAQLTQNQIRTESRKYLLSDPFLANAMMVKSMEDLHQEGITGGVLNIDVPIMVARTRFLERFKGNYVYHALNHLDQAIYHQLAIDDGHGMKDDAVLCLHQLRAEIGNAYADMDIDVIRTQTEKIKLEFGK